MKNQKELKQESFRQISIACFVNYSLVFTTKKIVQGSSWHLSGPRWIDSSLDLKKNMKIRTRGLQTRSGWLLKTWRGAGGGYDRLVNTRTIFHNLLRTWDLCYSLVAPISCSCMKAHVSGFQSKIITPSFGELMGWHASCNILYIDPPSSLWTSILKT